MKAIAWQMHAHMRPDHERRAFRKQQEACCVIGTNSDANQWREPEVMHAYKAPAQVEGACACSKTTFTPPHSEVSSSR